MVSLDHLSRATMNMLMIVSPVRGPNVRARLPRWPTRGASRVIRCTALTAKALGGVDEKGCGVESYRLSFQGDAAEGQCLKFAETLRSSVPRLAQKDIEQT